jgi:alcohol dehydrogenase (cytochrome c)
MLWVNTYALSANVAPTTNRGAAYSNGRIYRGFADGHVIAIDATTGQTVWNQSIIASGSLEFISGAPIAWKTSVIVGTAGGESGQLCRVVALDGASGKLLWSDQTVPNPGAPGSSTWKGATHIAGGATWTSLTIDPATGQLFVPVGNPGPDYDVRKRIGANLDTVSILDLDAATGALVEEIQTIAEDDHDWDQAAAPAVVTLASGEKIALVAGKDGYLRSIDLSSFAQQWQTAVTTITNATAPIVVKGTHFCPAGGVFWNGAAYSPLSGLAYVNAADWCKTVKLEPKPVAYVSGQPWLGSSDGDGVKDPTQTGWLSAVNATTGKTIWNYHSTHPLVAGVTPTAGGLVFTADLSGNVLAFNAATGALLQTVATGLAVGGGVISYEVGGTQYVAVAAGMTSSNFGTPAANSEIAILGL